MVLQKALLLLFCGLLAGLPAAYSLDLTVIQAGNGTGGTWAWLHSGNLQTQEAGLRFIDANSGRLVYEWRGRWNAAAPSWLRLSLPTGSFRVQAWCGAEMAQTQYACHPLEDNNLFMSDLVLANASFPSLAGAVPLPYDNGLPVAGWIGVAIEGNISEPLALRAALYRRGYDTPLAETYLPMQEYAAVLQPRRSTIWAQPLDMAALPEGEYRQEIRLYRGEALLGRRTLQFVRPWEGERRILADVYAAIDQMRYIFPASVCDSLRAISPATAAFVGWRKVWERRYGPDTQTEIKTYYDRIAEAQRRFGSWRCFRAALWARYGAPQSTRYAESHEIWKYRFGEIVVK